MEKELRMEEQQKTENNMKQKLLRKHNYINIRIE